MRRTDALDLVDRPLPQVAVDLTVDLAVEPSATAPDLRVEHLADVLPLGPRRAAARQARLGRLVARQAVDARRSAVVQAVVLQDGGGRRAGHRR